MSSQCWSSRGHRHGGSGTGAVTRRLVQLLLAVTLVMAAFPALAAAAEAREVSYTRIASVNGKVQVTADAYRNGMSNDDNNITACTQFDSLKGNFVLRVVMGEFEDYIIPTSGATTVCDVLTSSAVDGKYRWSASNPALSQWDGYSSAVGQATQWERGLGGAPFSYLETTTADGAALRPTIAFWGYDDDEVTGEGTGTAGSVTLGHKGGCCAHVAHEPSSWFQPFEIHLSDAMDDDRLYLTWVAKPAAVVLGAPLVFMVKVWNFRGEPLAGNPTFTVDLNGMKTVTQSSTNGRATLVFEGSISTAEFASLKEGGTFTLTVSTTLSQLPSSASSISLALPVLPSYNAQGVSLKPCTSTSGVSEMLHFGPQTFAIAPVSRFSAFDNDWFAASSLSTSGSAGESFLQPVEGHAGVAQADPALPPVTQDWTKITSTESDGTFSGRYALGSKTATQAAEVNGSLQFYAFTLYAAVAQDLVVQLTASEAYALFIDHAEVEPPTGATSEYTGSGGATTQRSTFSYHITVGYHQVLIKLFSSQVPQDNAVYSTLNVKVLGTGVAYTLEAPLEIPEGAYNMTSGSYMYFLLNNGVNAVDMLYADTIDQDLIDVHGASPRLGGAVVSADQLKTEAGGSDPNAAKNWASAVFYGGNIAVDGSSIPANRNYAVKYVALALYNQYDTDVTVDWQLVVKGHTEMYMDGVLQYSAKEGAVDEAYVTTALTPGWHQLIVRLATPRDNTWIFRFYMFFSGYRLIGSLQVRQSYTLPIGARVVSDGVPVQAMLELTAMDQAVTSDKLAAMITYNVSNATEADVAFLPSGLSLMRHEAGGTVRHQSFNAYAAETLSLSTTASAGLSSVFEWIPTTKLQDGVWGHVAEDKLAGGYYRLWAFSIYAVESVKLQADIDFVGGFALWCDGALQGAVQLSEETRGRAQETLVSFQVTEGWHQVVLKLQVPSTFHLSETEGEDGITWKSWLDVTNLCKETLGSSHKMCASQAYCPFGSPRAGVGLPITSKNMSDSPNVYAPVYDAENMFIQLAGPVEGAAVSPQPLCSTANLTVLAGNDLTDYGAGKLIGCCQVIRAPFITVKFVVPESVKNKLGYNYHELISIATPKITRSPAYLGTQTVTITTETDEAGIRYRLANQDNWTEYTEPFLVHATTTVQAQSYLGSRTSGTVSMELDVPEVITFDRTECLYDQPCPLLFTGANLGDLASLVARNQPPKTVQSYANITFARTQMRSNVFSGVSEMDQDTLTVTMRVTAPADSAGDVAQYVVMVYNAANGTQEGYLNVRRGLTLVPKTVAAESEALFMVSTFLTSADTVVFPQLHREIDSEGRQLSTYYADSGDEGACSVATCQSAITNYANTHGAAVTVARTFQVDLSAVTRTTLTCMCVCLGCRTRLASGALTTTFVDKPDRVAALPVNVRIVGLSGGESTTPPSKDTAGLVFIVLLPILVVLVVGGIGLMFYCRARRRRDTSRKLRTSAATVVDITEQDPVWPPSVSPNSQDAENRFNGRVNPMQTSREEEATTELIGLPVVEGSTTEKAAPSYPSSPLTRP